MSFSGAGGVVACLTLCGVEPGQVSRVTICQGHHELLHVPTVTDEHGAEISAGLALVNRARLAGRSGMRMEFGERPGEGVNTSTPIVLSAWLTNEPPGSSLQVVVTYWPDYSIGRP